MLLDLNQKFVNIEGEVLQDAKQVPDGKDKDGKDKFKVELTDLTLYRILTLALVEPAKNTKPDDRVKYYELISKLVVAKAGTVELEAEDITILKNAIKQKYTSPMVIGESLEMLEGKELSIKRAFDDNRKDVDNVEEYSE